VEKTTSVVATRPVCSTPRAFCHFFTAVAVALVYLSSTVRAFASANPSATRFSSSWRMSSPFSTPDDRLRHIGLSPNSSAGPGAPSTSHSVPPRSITDPSAGSAVMTPSGPPPIVRAAP
jgi:hypothetical protein